MLPQDATERKALPIATGVLDYFPLALAEVARVSKVGNDQHNPGQPLHWDRAKSTDHADCIARHLIQRGTLDSDGMRHSAKVAWRALALLQEELEPTQAINPTLEAIKAFKPKLEGLRYIEMPEFPWTYWLHQAPSVLSNAVIAWKRSPDGPVTYSRPSQLGPQFNVYDVWWRPLVEGECANQT